MDYLLFDSINFFIAIIIFIIWIRKKHISVNAKLIYGILFLSLHSSYNIMIKPIHDYNIAITRNFIWRFSIIFRLSLYDVIYLFLFLFCIKKFFNYACKHKIIFILIFRDLLIIIIGTLSYFLFKSYWLDNGFNYMMTMRGLIYFITTFTIVITHLNHSIKPHSYIFPISLILLSGFLTTLIVPIRYLWIRYGMPVIIIDQEDAGGISIFIITYIVVLLLISKDNRKIKNFIIFFLLFIQNALCIYKTNIIYYFYMPFCYLFFIKMNLKRIVTVIFCFVLSVIIISVNFERLETLLYSMAINTRITQIKDYFKYGNEISPLSNVIGLGIGSPYKAYTQTGDAGEQKIIDSEQYTEYKFAFQIPFLTVHKSSGFAGASFFVITSIYVVYIMHRISRHHYLEKMHMFDRTELITIFIYIPFLFLFDVKIYGGTTPIPIFYGFLIGRLYYLLGKIKQSS